jgi:putative FmdB family regulatory protein
LAVVGSECQPTRSGGTPAGRPTQLRPEDPALPTYQYRCTECGHAFEQFQSFTDEALTVCPQCEGRLRKVYNAVGVVFKGSGFYRNDSRGATSSTETPAAAKPGDSSTSSSTPDSSPSPAKSADSSSTPTPASTGSGSGSSSS